MLHMAIIQVLWGFLILAILKKELDYEENQNAIEITKNENINFSYLSESSWSDSSWNIVLNPSYDPNYRKNSTKIGILIPNKFRTELSLALTVMKQRFPFVVCPNS